MFNQFLTLGYSLSNSFIKSSCEITNPLTIFGSLILISRDYTAVNDLITQQLSVHVKIVLSVS
jgi:hypothetical protein